jgi:DNA-directed RNA polymerase specialized sigma24 family protein
VPLALHDIDDAERFVGSIVGRSGLKLSWDAREDLEQFLLTTAWEISLTFEPRRSSVGFSTYCGTILRRRTHDWVRQKNGRTKWQFRNPDGSLRIHEREPRPRLVPFDDSARDRLEQSLAEGDGDREAGGDLSFAGLDSDGNRPRLSDYEALGLEPPR